MPERETEGGAWIAVDRDHRLVAVMSHYAATDAASARQDAEALLDMARARYRPTRDVPPPLPPSGWRDSSADGSLDDSDDFDTGGEEWWKK